MLKRILGREQAIDAGILSQKRGQRRIGGGLIEGIIALNLEMGDRKFDRAELPLSWLI